MFGNRAIWAGGWKAVAAHQRDVHWVFPQPFEDDRWELYHLDDDFSELDDLADRHPDKVRELIERWWSEAGKYNVLPLDDRGIGRALRPQQQTVFTYYPGMSGLHPIVAGAHRGPEPHHHRRGRPRRRVGRGRAARHRRPLRGVDLLRAATTGSSTSTTTWAWSAT